MRYDIIVAGAGLAGLSFVHHLLKSGDRRKILLLDSSDKKSNDRTWSFWANEAPPYKCATRSWNRIGFAAEEWVRYDDITPFKYYTIHGIDFYREVFQLLTSCTNVTFRREEIREILDEEDQVSVETSKGHYQADLVIDSVSRTDLSSSGYNLARQNFLGWTIKADQAVFKGQDPILMDFRMVQDDDAANFVYLLPYCENTALVEYTSFTKNKNIDSLKYQERLQQYITEQIGVVAYQVLEEELGQIPMTNYPFERKPSPNVIRLGTIGGDTKPTTGYTFQRVQKTCEYLVEHLSDSSLTIPESPARFKFYDELLLKIIRDEPQKIRPVMEFLFRNNPVDRVLRFLDEDTGLLEESLILGLLPWKPFLKAIIRK